MDKYIKDDKVIYYGVVYEVIEKDLLTDVYRLKGEFDETSASESDLTPYIEEEIFDNERLFGTGHVFKENKKETTFTSWPHPSGTFQLETYQERLKQECKDLVTKYHKLVDFFKTQEFYELPRSEKNLFYRQNGVMNEYIQILGERMELAGINRRR